MGRRLPRAHEDDEEALRKLRVQCFKRVYQAWYQWKSLRVAGLIIIDSVIAPNGEEIYLPDLLTGYPYLPRRQQQSFEYICMQSYTEAAATQEIYGDDADDLDDDGNPVLDPSGQPQKKKRSSTVVQQYAQQALERMISAYDDVQAGTWDPIAIMKTRKLNGKVVHHDVVTARRRGLEARSQGRRTAGQPPGHPDHRSGEDGDPERGPADAAAGPRGLQLVRHR